MEHFLKRKKRKKEIKDFEILIAINGTTDRTEYVVKEFMKKYREIRYIDCGKVDAKGMAIIEGFKDAEKIQKTTSLVLLTGDMSTPPEAYYDLVKNIGIYYGKLHSIWNKKSVVTRKQSGFRGFISRGYNLIVRALLSFLKQYNKTISNPHLLFPNLFMFFSKTSLLNNFAPH